MPAFSTYNGVVLDRLARHDVPTTSESLSYVIVSYEESIFGNIDQDVLELLGSAHVYSRALHQTNEIVRGLVREFRDPAEAAYVYSRLQRTFGDLPLHLNLRGVPIKKGPMRLTNE